LGLRIDPLKEIKPPKKRRSLIALADWMENLWWNRPVLNRRNVEA